jgi:hypothetical protein
MTVARLLRSTATAATPVHARLLWSSATSTVTTVSAVHARILRTIAAVTTAPQVIPPTTTTIGPGESVVLGATLASGETADTWTWRQISGTTATLTGTGATRTLIGPSSPTPTAPIVLGIRATVGGASSPEVTVQITLLPQLSWVCGPSGWVGRRTVPR